MDFVKAIEIYKKEKIKKVQKISEKIAKRTCILKTIVL